jgi:hypothetical protein
MNRNILRIKRYTRKLILSNRMKYAFFRDTENTRKPRKPVALELRALGYIFQVFNA